LTILAFCILEIGIWDFRLMVLELKIGDVLRLKKGHPCGDNAWVVVRLGADIGLKCLKCQHIVMLERTVLERRIKGFLSRGD
jgi:hypothetical protein